VRKPGKCPHCGGESNGKIGYSSPPTTWCSDCGKPWTFGSGIKQVSDEERKRMRPGYPPER